MITADEILEYRKFHGIENSIQDMGLAEYADALENGAVVMIDSHGYIVDSFTGMVLAADGEQLDTLIDHLEKLRKDMPKKNKRDLLSK